MKKNILLCCGLIILICHVNQSHAQQSTLSAPCQNMMGVYCNADLSRQIPGLRIDSLVGNKAIIFGKKTNSAFLYKDVLYGNDPNRKCDTLDPHKTYCLDNPESLGYNVYYPDSLNGKKITCALPFIVIFHGGSFYECASHDNYGILILCHELAKRGFVVFDAEYRSGVLTDPRIGKKGYHFVSAQETLGIYRACQDARGAIRSIIYRQRIDNNGADFKIDTNRIFLAGISAGSIIALSTAYIERQSQVDSLHDSPGKVLGNLNAPFYFGDTTVAYFPKIRGVLDMWGSMGISKDYWNNPGKFLDGNTNIPAMISFQGQLDNLLGIGQQYMYESADSLGGKYKTNFNTERNCLVFGDEFSIDKDPDSPDAISLGADPLYAILKSKGIPTEEYVDTDMKHGMDDCDTCHDNTFFKSDFGTGLHTQEDVYAYIAGRAANFFTVVINNTADKLNTTRFLDCENKRTSCITADNNACTVYAKVTSNFAQLSKLSTANKRINRK